MKHILLASLFILPVIHADYQKQVNGYVKSNGTYVAPYIRSTPNGNPYDNIKPKK